MDLPTLDLQILNAWFKAAKLALDTAASVKTLLPSGPRRDEIAVKVAEAETALSASNAMLAQGLGFRLCKCTFPPQVMLYRHAAHHDVCPACGYKVRRLPRQDQTA